MKSTYKKLSLLFILSVIYAVNLFGQQINWEADFYDGCAPLTVEFTNTSTDTAGVTFIWNYGDGSLADTTFETTHTFTSSGSHWVNLKAYDNLWNYIGEYSSNINAWGSSGMFYMSPDSTACPGEEISFYTYDNYYSLEWDFGDGSPHEEWNWIEHIYTDTGIYNVTLLIETQCGVDTIAQTINITDTATPDVEINISTNTVCPGDEIKFSCYDDAESYYWDFCDGNNSTDNEVYHSYADIGAYVVTLTVINICGNSNADTVYISVENDVPLWAGFNYWSQSSCPNDAVNFYPWNPGDYFWDFDDGSFSTESEPKHYFADTGIYNVQLIIENGCGYSDTAYQDVYIQYNPYDTPNAEIHFENEDWYVDTITICPAEEVFFENNTWSQGNLTYLWNFGDGATSTEEDASHIFNIAGNYEVMMIATNNCMGKDTASKWVNVDPSLMPEAELMAVPDTICQGEKVYFFDEGTDIEESNYLYSIWFGDGDSLVNITEITDSLVEVLASHTYNTIGSYEYLFTVTNSCGNTDSLIDTIIVSNTSATNPFYYVHNSTIGYDEGGAEIFSDWSQPTGPDDHVFTIPVTWAEWVPGMNDQFYLVFWLGGVDWSAGGPPGNPDGIVVLEGLGTATVYVPNQSDSVGILGAWWCNGEIVDEPDAMGFLPNQPIIPGGSTDIPAPGIVLGNWDGSCINEYAVCPGDLVEFIIAGGISYEWHFGDGSPVSTDQATYHAYADTGYYDAYVIITNGCSDIDTVYTNVEIRDYNTPDAHFDISDYMTCAYDTIYFEYEDKGDGIDNNTYSWDFDDGTTSTEKEPYHIYTEGGEYDVELTVTNGCGSNSESETITIEQPEVDFYADETEDVTCYGGSDGYANANVSGGVSPYSYEWSNGATTSDITDVSAGTYTVTVTGADGCTNISSITLTELSDLAITMTITNESVVGESDGAVDITVSGGTPPYTYLWSNEDTTSSVTNLSAGDYIVTVTEATGDSCTIIDTATVGVGSAVADIFDNGLILKVYPNPAQDNVTFEYSLPETVNEVVIEVKDVSGKLLNSLNITERKGKTTLNTKYFAEGIYIYSIFLDGRIIANKKLVIIR